MNRVIEWFAVNPVAANLVMGFAIIGGVTALLQIPVKPYPDFEVPSVIVGMDYPGAAPEEVEVGVCQRIEEAVIGIRGVDTVRSSAAEGTCAVRMDLFFDADRQAARDEIENRVQAIDTFPAEAEKLLVHDVTSAETVAEVVVTGPTDERALKELARRVRDDLRNDPAIGHVSLVNTRPYEISVEISEASLQRHGMTFDEVALALRRRSVDVPGGSIRSADGEVLLRTRGQAYWGEELEQLPVRVRPDGTRVLVGDVARVVDGFADTGQELRFDGVPAALLQVSRGGDQDARRIVRAVREFVAAAPSRYPHGVELKLWTDESSQLADRVGALLDAGAQGLLLVLVLLVLLLRPHVALWVAVGIPIAILGAAYLVYLLGLSLDAISIIGFIIALGMLVDDAVVVGERVHAQQRGGVDPVADAVAGAQQVQVPVTFGVLTTIAAFAPLLFAAGLVGQVLSITAVVVICSLVFSLIECHCVLPAHLGHRNRVLPLGEFGIVFLAAASLASIVVMPDARSGLALAVLVAALVLAARMVGLLPKLEGVFGAFQTRFDERLQGLVEKRFRRLVETTLRRRTVTGAFAFVALATALAIVAGGHLPFSLLLDTKGDRVVVQLTMPPGVNPAATRGVLAAVERAAAGLQADLAAAHGEPVILHVLKATGGHPSSEASVSAVREPSGPHLGEVVVQLSSGEHRPIDTDAVAALLHERMGDAPEGAELDFVTARVGASPDIDVRFSGPDMPELRAASAALRGALAQYPGVYQIGDTLVAGKEEFELSVTPAGESLGVGLLDLGRQLRQAFFGEEVQRIQRGEDDIRLMVRYSQAERRSLDALDDLRIRVSDGGAVPFRTVSELRALQGPATINRTDGFRSVNVTARVDTNITSASVVLRNLEETFLPDLLRRYPGVAHTVDSLREQEQIRASVLPPLLLALFAVYALLSIPLRSYIQPLVVLTVVPFVVVGAILGHALLDVTGHVVGLSMASVFGMVAASGVAVNATLVLLHAVNRRRAAGDALQDALAAAAVSRFRPIMITTVTTFAGLAPLIFSRSVAAQSLVPLAVSLAFGVLAAGIAALLAVPALWLAASGLRNRVQRLATTAAARQPGA